MKSLQEIIKAASQRERAVVAVVSPEDPEVMSAVEMAVEQGLASFLLVGDEDAIRTHFTGAIPRYEEEGLVTVLHAEKGQAAPMAVKKVRDGAATVLMKGHIDTASLLKAVLNKEEGLRTGNVLSHVALFEVPSLNRLIFVTDAAMNVSPGLKEKAQIIQNAVAIAHSLGFTKPKVAPLAAVEVVNPAMEATLDAAALTVMSQRGQLKGCIVDGPLALDNAISPKAAEQKGISGEVAGRADILLVPSIEAGNILYKSLMYMGNSEVGAVIAGAKAPIVLTSRADSAKSKLQSLAVAICSAN